MSFSTEVKEELSKHVGSGRHCQIAELTAIIYMIGKIQCINNQKKLMLNTENELLSKKSSYLIKKLIGYETNIIESNNKRIIAYKIIIEDDEVVDKILTMTKLSFNDNIDVDIHVQQLNMDAIVIQKVCCKRAFLRGVFITSGSLADPVKAYHLEIVCIAEESAKRIQQILIDFDLEAKIVLRKKYFVVYIKEGSMIVDALNIMEAHASLMSMENVRIVKSMRNTINRRVNCETANLNKTVSAAVRQLEDIKYIEKVKGLSELSQQLRDLATLRIEEPDASLKELGEMLNPPVSKSGVNHRLRKLSEIANDLREKNIY